MTAAPPMIPPATHPRTTARRPQRVLPAIRFLHLLLLILLAAFPTHIPLASTSDTTPTPAPSKPDVLLVVGAQGEPEFGTNFLQQAEPWRQACQAASANLTVVGLSPSDPSPPADDLHRLKSALHDLPRDGSDAWVVLVGHGTFDGREARFNLRGPDLTASNLVEWLQPFKRRLIVVNTASASAPFLKPLSATNRIVITATRSGNEINFTRFGSRFAQAIQQPSADLDQDGQTSLLEAFLSASFQVAEFYKTEGRLATEHALIDDNGDGLGTPADWFRGLRPVKRPRDNAALDGLRAHQVHLIPSPAENQLPAPVRARRDALEIEIAELRDRKASMAETLYYAELEQRLRSLASLYFPEPRPAPASTNAPTNAPADVPKPAPTPGTEPEPPGPGSRPTSP